MNRFRIRCLAPPPPPPDPDSRFPLINGFIASLVDCEVRLVLEDGTEHDVPGVMSVRFAVGGGNRQMDPARAEIVIDGAEVDIDLPVDAVTVLRHA